MHATTLRQVGGPVMLALPPAVLDLLRLRAGSKANLALEGGRLILVPKTQPECTIDESLTHCDESLPADDEDRAWLEAKPVGNELL